MAARIQHVYRDLLRMVRRHAKGDHFSDFICQKFRDSAAANDVDALQKSVALAKDYAYLVKSVHAHKVRGVLCICAHFCFRFVFFLLQMR